MAERSEQRVRAMSVKVGQGESTDAEVTLVFVLENGRQLDVVLPRDVLYNKLRDDVSREHKRQSAPFRGAFLTRPFTVNRTK